MTRKGWVLFAAVSVVWGMPYLFIKVAVEGGISPAFLSFARVAMAGALLLPLAWRSGALRGLRAKLVPLAAFAFFEIVIPFPLIAFGEQRVTSSLAAIIVASLPLVIALIALRFDHEERATGARLGGMFIGLGGVVVLFGIDVAGDGHELVGALCILLATVGYAVGPMIVKRHLSGAGDPVGPVAVAMVFAAAMLAPAALLSAPSEVPPDDALASMVVLGLVCTALAFLLYFTLIGEVGPSRASVITYINPVVAVALGVAILGEPVTAGAAAGLLLILAGSWLSTGGRPPSGLAEAIRRALGQPAREAGRDPAGERAQCRVGGVGAAGPVHAAAGMRGG